MSEVKINYCIKCGADKAGSFIELGNGRFKCKYCSAEFEKQTLDKSMQEIMSTIGTNMDESIRLGLFAEKERKIANYRQQLYKAVTQEYLSDNEIKKWSDKIKEECPDDFMAEFYGIAISKNIAEINEFLDNIDVKEKADYLSGVIDFMLKTAEYENILSIENIIDTGIKDERQTVYLNCVQELAGNLKGGLYDTEIPRDAFIAYSSKDFKEVNKIVTELESQSFNCFVAMRNLRHGKGARENYVKELQKAMNCCDCFVFISSKNSRQPDCDAVKLEMPYIRDVLRNKPRIEYVLDTVKTGNFAEKKIEKFFNGLEYCRNVDDLAERISAATEITTDIEETETTQNKKYCVDCLTENDIKAKFCYECGGTEFAPSIKEAAQKAKEKAIEEARKQAEEEVKKATEELKRKQEELLAEKAKEEEEKRKAEEKRLEAEKKKKEEEAEKKAEAERLEAEKKRQEEKRKAEAEEAARKAEEERKAKEAKTIKRINEKGLADEKGKYILFGEYPQTIKAGSVSITSTTDDRGYFLGSDHYYYAKVTATPNDKGYKFSTGSNVEEGKTYYFKVEPIKWRILSEENGRAFVLCENILANHSFDEGKNNYETSEIRAWLNDTFYNTAFTDLQRELILKTMVDNSERSTNPNNNATYENGGKNEYACKNTEDYVFLLSVQEVTNSKYGFNSDCTNSDTLRRMKTTDYSRATGAWTRFDNDEYDGNGWWWLRSPDYAPSNYPRYVSFDGNAYEYEVFCLIHRGAVPAICVKTSGLKSDTKNNKIEKDKPSEPEKKAEAERLEAEKKRQEEKRKAEAEEAARKAEEERKKQENIKNFEIKKSVLVKYKGIGGDVIIPDCVTSIGSYAFKGCSSLTSIVIPSSVTSMGDYAFKGCSRLTSIEIPSSVTSIGSNAFSGCRKITSIYYLGDIAGWCKISRLGGLMSSGSSNIDIYLNGTKIEGELVIPSSVTSIGSYAFDGCSSLTSIEIPSRVTSIGEKAFSNCSSLTSINVADDNAYFKSIDGNLYNKNATTLIQYAIGKTNTSFVIPSTVTSIGSYAFYNCSSLTSIEIPSGVTSIGSYAFLNCRSLTSIEIPSSVTSIGHYAFSGCSRLTSIVIPSSVTSIGERAFYNCSSLTSIEIPSSVTSIGSYAFEECSSLTSIEIPSSVTSIGSYTFYNCSSLTSIEIPSSVTSIGSYAFYRCSSLTSIEIPSSVTSIGLGAFQNCRSITSIEIPSSVTSIGWDAFEGCHNLTINCEMEKPLFGLPKGWSKDWLGDKKPYPKVIWGIKK